MPSFLIDQLSYLVTNIIDNHRKNSCCVPKPPGGSVVKVSRQCKGGKPSGADTEQRMRHQQVGSRPIYLSLRPRPWCKQGPQKVPAVPPHWHAPARNSENAWKSREPPGENTFHNWFPTSPSEDRVPIDFIV